MRILIVTPLVPPEPGGPSYYSVALKVALERKGETVSLIAFREVRRLPSGLRHLVFAAKVSRAARQHDILIVLDTLSVALPAVLAARLARKPLLIRTGGDFVWERYIERTGEKVLLSEFYGRVLSGALRLSRKERLLMWLQKHVVFPYTTRLVYSTAWQRDLWATPYAVPYERTALIENSAPPPAFDLRARRSAAPARDIGFLCIWRPTAFKNVDTLKRAYELYRREAGANALSLTLRENVPRELFYEELARARALVVPSLSEISPNIVLESLAAGVPVLLTQDCGMQDRFGEAVRYLNPRSPESIAAALHSASDDAEYALLLKKAAAFSYVRTYDDIAEDFLLLCGGILHTHV